MDIKGITRQQHRATAAERLRMVELFRRSGLKRAAFSRQFGIPLSTLDTWRVKARRDASPPVPAVFNEVRLASSASPPAQAWAIEVVAPSGMTVRCREALPARDLVRLLRGTRC